MQRKGLKWFFYSVAAIMAIFLLVQILVSLVDLILSHSNLIQLTFVKPENNLDVQRHPYYTVCPIFETSADLSDPDMDLQRAMTLNSRYYPVALFLAIMNSQSLTMDRFTTWVKMKDASKNQRELFVQCTTFSIPNNVSLGQNEGKVRYNI